MKERVRCAVVGCGVIGEVHAALLAALPDAELVACCDVVPERMADFAARFQIPRQVRDYAELLTAPDIDSVTICTPHYLHAPMVQQAARAGKNVLVEKPLATDAEEAHAAVAACRQQDVRLGVCLQNRLNTATRQVQRALETGMLGDVLVVTGEVLWYRDEEYYTGSPWRGRWATEGGGVLINQAIHTLDLVALFGGPVRTVTARIATLGHASIEVEDVAAAILAYDSGALGTFTATTCAYPGSEVRVTVIGSKGSATIVGQELTQFATRDGCVHPPDVPARPVPLPANGKDYYGSSHGLVIQDFLTAVREGRDPCITGEDGAVSVDLLTAIYASARTGTEQAVARALVGAPTR